MAILPATIFNQNSNPLDAIFSQATNGLQSSLNAAIQRGQQIASTQLQQENAFLQERARQQELEDRKAKNIRDIFNEERTLANKNTNDQYQIIENNRINNRADRAMNLQQQDAVRLSEYMNQVNGVGGQSQTTGTPMVGAKNGIADFYNSLVQSEQAQPAPFGTTPTQASPSQPVASGFVNQFNQPIQRETIVGSATPQPSNAAVDTSASTMLSSNNARNAPAAPVLNTNQGITNLLSFQQNQAKSEQALAKGKVDQTRRLNDLTQDERDQYSALVQQDPKLGVSYLANLGVMGSEITSLNKAFSNTPKVIGQLSKEQQDQINNAAKTDTREAARIALSYGIPASEVEKSFKLYDKSTEEKLKIVSDINAFTDLPEKEIAYIAERVVNSEGKEKELEAQKTAFANIPIREKQANSTEAVNKRQQAFDQVGKDIKTLQKNNVKLKGETNEQYAQRLARLYYASEEQQQAVQAPQAAQATTAQAAQAKTVQEKPNGGYTTKQAENLSSILQPKEQAGSTQK